MHKLLRRRLRLLSLIVAVAGLGIAASVSPAMAGNTPVSVGSCGVFENLLWFGTSGSSTARGEDGREPALNQVLEDVPANAKGKGGEDFRVTIPVYFHVVTPDGVTGNVSLEAIREQVRVLNVTFGGGEGGFDTGFRFTLAGVTRTVNADWFYAGPTTKAERDMKKALRQGGSNALNHYSTTAGPYLGWAYYPNILQSPGNAYLDGIVVDWESMKGTSTRYEGRYDQGETATHEAGHWLNLAHTFEGGCNRWGDHVDDTPPMLVPTTGCPEGKDTCSEPGLDPIHNYMDYSYDTCYTEFTPGQAVRMQDAYLHWRA
jgi:hypothetical protein